MRVGIVNNTNFINKDKKISFQGTRSFVEILVDAEKIEKRKIRASSRVREVVEGLRSLIENPYYERVKTFEVTNRKAIASAARTLKSSKTTFKDKREALNGILEKTKESKDAKELYYYVLRRFIPHVVKSKDERMAKYILKLTENPITKLDTLGEFRFFYVRMELISQLGSKRNIKDIKREKQRVEFVTEQITAKAEEAIKKLQTSPNF